MVRYDKMESVDKIKSEVVEKKQLVIDKEHQTKIIENFLRLLTSFKINDVQLIKVNQQTLIFSNDISLEQLSESLGKSLVSRVQFLKELYTHKLDDFINEAYGEEVIAIQEVPYSFTANPQNENVITFEFLI